MRMRIGVDATNIVATSDSLTSNLVAPPADGEGICPRCRTWADEDSDNAEHPGECENCRDVRTALGMDPLRLAVVSMYKKPSDLRDWLTRYKGRDDEEDVYEPAFVDIVRSIFGRFVIEHGQALEAAAGTFDAMVVVPSTSRPGRHPLEAVLESLGLDTPLLHLLERGAGDLGFRRPAKDGFKVTGDHESMRVILVDDVYTTGSRLNSAAAALTVAGHHVSAGLVLARRVNPAYNQRAAALWQTAASAPFRWETSPWVPA